jgi:cytochrome c oxidase subunit 2
MKRYVAGKIFFTLSLLFLIAGPAHTQAAAPVIEIHAKRFAFTPNEITIVEGQTATIKLISDDTAHSLVIPDLQVNVEVSKRHPAQFSITPTKTGDFAGRCGHFCGAGHGNMTFTVHVKGG